MQQWKPIQDGDFKLIFFSGPDDNQGLGRLFDKQHANRWSGGTGQQTERKEKSLNLIALST